jgi:double-strand break repair protein MRE11
MYQPSDGGDWFSMLVLHQNRAQHTIKSTIAEEMLPEFLDMVFWGHEHGCRVEEEYNAQRTFYVTQPGTGA